ncbi:MAG: hypothetical protein CVU42_14290 [Chloroflexi bacterium HGW-Chloroflexi-4]|jgi:methyl-accepting chemotaxis protein|nr:MAG: hypothetical protein CVU42_14290 [Chloroflexi bacterium HGW-Chloroflexi-4]
MSAEKKKRNRFWTDWKIGGKVISVVLVISLISVAVLLTVNYLTNVRETNKTAGNQLLVLGDEVILRAAGQVLNEVKVLETLSRTPSLIDAIALANEERADLTDKDIESLDQAWKDDLPSIASEVFKVSNNVTTKFLKEFIKQNPQEVEVFVTDVKGLNVAMTDRTSDFWQADEGWWNSAYAEGKGSAFIAEVEYDESTKAYAMNIGVPVYDQSNKVIGILRGTLDVSSLITTLGSVKVGETGNATLIDANGNILFNQDSALIMQPAPEAIMALFASGESGWTQGHNLQGDEAVLAYSQLKGETAQKLRWNILMVQDQEEVNQTIITSLIMSFVAALAVIILGIFFTLIAVRFITKPMKTITDSFYQLATGDLSLSGLDLGYLEKIKSQQDEIGDMSRAGSSLINYLKDMVLVVEKVAKGDLSVKVNARSEKDQLGTAFSDMTGQLKGLVSQVTDSAKKVEIASGGLANAASQASRATEQISATIQQMATGTNEFATTVTRTTQSVEQMSMAIDGVANGAQDQAQAVGQATTIAAQISNTIRDIADNAQSSAKAASEAADTARTGAQTVEETINGMNSIKSKVGISVVKVQEMGERSSQIGSIVQTIEEISSQTNLLALNAAIEAARAGEHGKGFAVVADEVRKLAERSSMATREISDLIGGIQLSVEEAVSAMNDGAQEVETGVERAGQSGVALESILNAVASVNAQVSSIAEAAQSINNSAVELDNSMGSVSAVVEENTAATEEMSASSSEVNSAMEVIAANSEETSASIQEVSASTEQMTAQVQEVTNSALELAALAELLRDLVTRFKLDEGEETVE